MTVDITVLIAVLGFALSVGTFFVGRMTAAKTNGIADGEMKSDVRHMTALEQKVNMLHGGDGA